jgi:hypothetical protein
MAPARVGLTKQPHNLEADFAGLRVRTHNRRGSIRVPAIRDRETCGRAMRLGNKMDVRADFGNLDKAQPRTIVAPFLSLTHSPMRLQWKQRAQRTMNYRVGDRLKFRRRRVGRALPVPDQEQQRDVLSLSDKALITLDLLCLGVDQS